MRIAVRYEVPSMEADFLAEMLGADHESVKIGPHDPSSHSYVYDWVICVGPVSSRPLAKNSVHFILGPIGNHIDVGCKTVVVTNPLAESLARKKLGYGVRIRMSNHPIFGLIYGRKRIVEDKVIWLSAIDNKPEELPQSMVDFSSSRVMNMWAKPVGNAELFNILEFNSLVRGGAVGKYYELDGYDIAVRRHLALGGRVTCLRGKNVLGDLADLVEGPNSRLGIESCSLDAPRDYGKIDPVDCAGRMDEYVSFVREVLKI